LQGFFGSCALGFTIVGAGAGRPVIFSTLNGEFLDQDCFLSMPLF